MGGGKTNIWRDLISPLFSHHPISCLRLPVLIVKQWGGKNKKAKGRELNGRTYDEMPATTA